MGVQADGACGRQRDGHAAHHRAAVVCGGHSGAGYAGVSPVLYDLLRPVLRANSGTGYSAAVKQKAEEVLALVQETVGGARMASCYAALRGSKERAREGKRKYLKLQAVLDPEATAHRRIRKGEKNRVQKKRKMDHVTAHKGKSMRRDVGSGVMRKN